MNDTLYSSIETVLNHKDESQFEIYCAIGDQLLKEFYIEQTHRQLYMESGSSGSNKPFDDDGRIPTIKKIADWFVRFITKLKSIVVRRHTLKQIERITKSRLYKENEDSHNNDYEYQVLFSDMHWMDAVDGLHESRKAVIKNWKKYVITDSTKIMNVMTSPDFRQIVKDVYKLREQCKDVWDDIKKVSAVNEVSKLQKMRHSALDNFLKDTKKQMEDTEQEIKEAYDAKDNMKKICEYITSQDMSLRYDMKRLSEQYVKFITDLIRSWMYIVEIYMRIVDRIWYSLGRVQHSSLTQKEDET
jgi:hypothetical protein